MTLARSSPQPFRPSSVVDAVESPRVMFSISGAMAALTNLIPDPSTAGVFTCRPASELLTDFTGSGIASPGTISVMHVSGLMLYGMIGSSNVAGYDSPFCYDLKANAFITVGGTQTAATLPLTQPTTGDWTPPTMDMIGVQLITTHPGFGVGGVRFGWFDVSNPAAPVWNAGNTTVNALPATPVAVAQFNGRAWYAVGNSVAFSDALAATVITNANQIITSGLPGDGLPVTALAGMPLSSPITGGIIQALIAFKGATTPYQITGDATTSDLSINGLNVTSGTLAPNTIVPTPKGLAFISPQGLRFLDFSMNVSDPIGHDGSGVVVPFVYALNPTRMCAAYTADTIRISVQNGYAPNTPWQEWWYHIPLQSWTGPHTFPAAFIHAFVHDNPPHQAFIVAPQGVPGKLFDSHSFPSLTPSYVENGVALTYVFQTSLFADTYQMSETNIVEQTVNMALPPGAMVSANALDQNLTVLDTVSLQGGSVTTIWDAFTWGVPLWFGGLNRYRPRQLTWDKGVTFRMLALRLSGESIGAPLTPLQVGAIYSRYEQLGYLQQEVP